MTIKVLVVEDEIKLAELLNDYLMQAGMKVKIVADGAQVLEVIDQYRPDIILLDIMLPNKDGLSLCSDIRDIELMKHIPIIMTTARVDEIDRLLGLDIGADDYVCKPYSPREIVARVKAIMRRLTPEEDPAKPSLVLDDEKMKALLGEKDLRLTAVEYAILTLMLDVPGKIFSRSQLMDNIYQDYRVVSERTIDSHIKKLRQKISVVNDSVEVIHSVYGVGYKAEVVVLEA